MKIDTNKIKSQFPIFDNQSGLVYLDNSATTLKPKMVLDKMNEYYEEYSANIHRGVYELSERATEEYEKAREKVADFIGAKSEEIIFTRGTTESINMVARGWGEMNVGQGDEIVVTEMEHHSNLVPWQMLAKKTGAVLKYIPINLGTNHKFQITRNKQTTNSKSSRQTGLRFASQSTEGELELSNLDRIITKKTKILAITQVSNVLGTVNPIKEIILQSRRLNSSLIVVVDGAQAVAHMPVDVVDLGCDFYGFSGHKMYGPTGVGVLWGRSELLEAMEPVNYGGGMIREVTWKDSRFAKAPEKFEGGTPPIAQALGLGAAVDFIRGLGWKVIVEQEKRTLKYLMDQLNKMFDIRILGLSGLDKRTGVVSMVLAGVHAHDVASILAADGVCVRAGHHCAMPLHDKLGLLASVRASLGVYNGTEDIDRLIITLHKAKNIFSNIHVGTN